MSASTASTAKRVTIDARTEHDSGETRYVEQLGEGATPA